MTFDQWFDFIVAFSAPNSRVGISQFPGSAADAIEHAIEFCLDPNPVLSKLTEASALSLLDIFPGIDGFGGLLSFQGLSPTDRLRFADSHVTLFGKAFAAASYPRQSFMWWEYLTGAQWDDGVIVHDDRQLCDHMMMVLRQILEIPSESCQRSALHGFHEFGPNTSQPNTALDIVLRALAESNWSDEVKSYAETVLNGTAQ